MLLMHHCQSLQSRAALKYRGFQTRDKPSVIQESQIRTCWKSKKPPSSGIGLFEQIEPRLIFTRLMKKIHSALSVKNDEGSFIGSQWTCVTVVYWLYDCWWKWAFCLDSAKCCKTDRTVDNGPKPTAKQPKVIWRQRHWINFHWPRQLRDLNLIDHAF